MAARADGRIGYKLHRTGEQVPEEYRGFGSVNAAATPENVYPWEAHYALNFTNRLGFFGDRQGILATRPGYAAEPRYGFPAYAGDPDGEAEITRALKKWYYGSGLKPSGQVVRWFGDKLQSLSGAAGWEDIVDSLSTAGYPEMVVYGKPQKVLVIPHPSEGLLCWDGTNFWHQSIPQGGGAGDITGCMIVAQMNGKLFVTENYFDAGEGLNVYYCGTGNLGNYANPTSTAQWEYPNGGMFRIYAVESRDSRSNPTRVTGAVEMLGRLVIFTETGRYIVTAPGTGSESIDYEPGAGCLSGRLIAAHMGRIYWADAENIYKYYGGDPLKIGHQVNPLLKHIKFLDDSGNLIAQNFFSFVHHGRIWFNIKTEGLRGISGDYINTNFIYDIERQTWEVWNIPMCAVTICESGIDMGMLYFASPEERTGGVYKCHRFQADDQSTPRGIEVFDDDGRDISAIWRTGRLGCGSEYEMTNKKFWALRFNMDLYKVTQFGGAAVNQFMDKDDDMPGLISLQAGSDQVVGTGTHFLRDLRVGQKIGPIETPITLSGTVLSIETDTRATLTVAYAHPSYSGDWGAFWAVDWPTDKKRTMIQKLGLNQTVGTRTALDILVSGQGRLSLKEMELIFEPLPLDQEEVCV